MEMNKLETEYVQLIEAHGKGKKKYCNGDDTNIEKEKVTAKRNGNDN